MSGLDALLGRMTASLGPSEVCALPLPADIADRSVDQGSGRLEFRTRMLDCLDAFEIRVANFAGPKLEITNFYAYPRPALALPVVGMQTVVMGQRPIVGVVDALELHGDAPAPFPPLLAARTAHADLGYCEDQPEWFRACRSGAELFLRPETHDALARIVDVTAGLLAEIGGRARAAAAAPDPTAHGAAIAAYKDHHRIHSEGLPLMHSRFGEAWTRRFMEEHFFA